MAYLHIDNLYKAQEILAFRTCYAMEKIHGTSAHISWNKGLIGFFSGGESHDRFVYLFYGMPLAEKFAERFTVDDKVIVYGEAYGGKQQRMSKTYGSELRFIAFDVKVGDAWLSVPQAQDFVEHLGLEFVDYREIPTTMRAIDKERDRRSAQAIRNGIKETRLREGVVLRPPFEVILNNGKRVIAKHKGEEFSERGTTAGVPIDPAQRQILKDAEAVALEWATPVRLEHVIDQLISEREDKTPVIQDTGKIVKLMIADVLREAEGEIVDTQPVRKEIGKRSAMLFKQFLHSQIEEG